MNLNPILINELNSTMFVINDVVLDDNYKRLIVGLLDSFSKLSTSSIVDNLELSKCYNLDEIVLKYNDASICLSNWHNQDGMVECQLSRGTVLLYLKKKYGDMYKYSRISVVKVDTNPITHSDNDLYQDTEEIIKIGTAADMAVGKYHMESITGKDLFDIHNLDRLCRRTKKILAESQLEKMCIGRILSTRPTHHAVTAAKSVMATNLGRDIRAVMIPNNGTMALQIDPMIKSASGRIDGNGIKLNEIKDLDTIGCYKSSLRASLLIDAVVALVDKKID